MNFSLISVQFHFNVILFTTSIQVQEMNWYLKIILNSTQYYDTHSTQFVQFYQVLKCHVMFSCYIYFQCFFFIIIWFK